MALPVTVAVRDLRGSIAATHVNIHSTDTTQVGGAVSRQALGCFTPVKALQILPIQETHSARTENVQLKIHRIQTNVLPIIKNN